jgi:putative membrane protein
MMGLGFGFVWMLLFWAGLIALAIWLIWVLFPSTNEKSNNDSTGTPSAQEILRARYANGELTKEEYHEMVSTIQRERIL